MGLNCAVWARQVDALRARLQAGQRREMGFIGMLAGIAALAVPRPGLGKFGLLLRTSVLVLAAANGCIALANFVWSAFVDGVPAVGLSLSRRPATPELPLQLLT